MSRNIGKLKKTIAQKLTKIESLKIFFGQKSNNSTTTCKTTTKDEK
jgi:hypothetical protein